MVISRSYILFSILVIVSLFPITGEVFADHELYSTNFSDAALWKTNSEASFYPEVATGRYHYLIEGGTGSYSSFELKEPVTGAFSLEFDVMPISTDKKSSFRFGIGNDEMDSQKGPLILAELNNQIGENLFSLTAISKENLISKTYSMPGKENYSGKTVKFDDGTTYHIKLTWYPADKRVSMTVTTPGKELPVFSHYVVVSGKIEELSHLFLTSAGEGQAGSKAEGFIDNITLTALDSVPDTSEPTPIGTPESSPEPTIAESDTELNPTETLLPVDPVRTPMPAPPKPTATPTQKAGVLPIVVIGALTGMMLLYRRDKT